MSRLPDVFTAGLCPVCRIEAIVLVSVDARKPVFWCSMCELVWYDAPNGECLDEIRSLEDLGPNAVRLPTVTEARGIVGVARGGGEAWEEELDELVQKGLLVSWRDAP